MKKLVAALFVVGLLGGTVALAGYNFPYPVSVTPTTHTVFGAFGSARNSDDAVQVLGCEVFVYSTGAPRVTCYAGNARGVYASCTSSDPDFVQAASAITTDSRVIFTWNESGTCTSLHFATTSMVEPRRL